MSLSLSLFFFLRHRSAGPGEAGATAAHLSGPKLHQQVHTHTTKGASVYRGQHCSTTESLYVCVSVRTCGLRTAAQMTDVFP